MPAQVLVVDQNPIVQTTIENSLRSQNCEVTSVRDALSGLDLAYKIKPDLMIADLRMEGLMVYSFCARVKQKPFLSHIPIFLLIQQNDVYDEARLRQSGIVGFIQKPVDPEKLKDTLSSFISRFSTHPTTAPPEGSMGSSTPSISIKNEGIGVSTFSGQDDKKAEEFNMEQTVFDNTIIENKSSQSFDKPDETVKIDDLMEWAQPEISPFSEVISPASNSASELTQLSDATQVMDISQLSPPSNSDDFSEVINLADVPRPSDDSGEASQFFISSPQLEGGKIDSGRNQNPLQEDLPGKFEKPESSPGKSSIKELEEGTESSSVNGRSNLTDVRHNSNLDLQSSAQLTRDLSKTAQEIIEKVAWEVVPHLTEQAIKTELIATIIEKVIWEILPPIAEQSVKEAIKKISEEQEHTPS